MHEWTAGIFSDQTKRRKQEPSSTSSTTVLRVAENLEDGLTRGTAAMKYHRIEGYWGWIEATFMPKNPTRKVRGKKMNVIQLKRHRLVASSSDCFESLIVTDLYI